RTQAEREDMTHTGRFAQEAERQFDDWLASSRTPEWREIQARLLAYSSQPVLDALQASERANGRVEHAFQNWKWMRDNVGGDPAENPTASDVLTAQDAIRPAMEDASRRDE